MQPASDSIAPTRAPLPRELSAPITVAEIRAEHKRSLVDWLRQGGAALSNEPTEVEAYRTILKRRFSLLCDHYGKNYEDEINNVLAWRMALDFVPGLQLEARKGRPPSVIHKATQRNDSLFQATQARVDALQRAKERAAVGGTPKQGRYKDADLQRRRKELVRIVDEGKESMHQARDVKPTTKRIIEDTLRAWADSKRVVFLKSWGLQHFPISEAAAVLAKRLPEMRRSLKSR